MSVTNKTQINDEILHEFLRAIEQLRYGSIEVVVHDGRVTQIERREKVRFNQIPEHSAQKIEPTTPNNPTAKAAAKH